MVVYEKGRPKRSDYRKFKIKWVQGPNDYASMEEVLTRRFTHESNGEFDSFARLPDLILMDGGRGQVNIALKVLNELGISIPVCGMVKDDHHRTRGLYFNNVEIPIDTSGEGFRLITRIQDEAHRFAIEYHRSLRSREQVHSILDDIPGIGDTRRKALLRKFKSVENIRDASEEELWRVLEQTKLSDFLKSEQGLDTVLTAQASNLSGGQRQRLALARALLHDSPVYLFDEATSNIDVESENDIMEQIIALAQKKTVIVISHRLANTVTADRIYVLADGKLAERGTHEKLLEKRGVYASLWNTQQALEHIEKEETA